MSSIPVLNDEQWLNLLKYAASDFNEVTLSRGFQYFKQQFVRSLSASGDHSLQARVAGTEQYTVTFHIDKPASGRCTCPVGYNCKHIAAVMMELGDRMGYPASQLVNAKHHIKQIALASPSEELLKQLPGKDVFGWHEAINEITAPVKPPYNQSQYIEELRYRLQHIRKASIPFSEIDSVYFDVHQELFVLRKFREQCTHGEYKYYTSFVLPRLYRDMHDLLRQKSAMSDFSLSEARLSQTLQYIRRQMAEETGFSFMEYGLYDVMWELWISHLPEIEIWVSRELDDIEKQSLLSPSLAAAKAFLYLQQSRNEDAWAVIETGGILKDIPSSFLLSFLYRISASGDWETLTNWLTKTASSFYRRRSPELEAYIRLWNEAAQHVPYAKQQMWSLLESMLPYSMSIIEDMLYEQREWKLWIEMQIQQEHDPLHHRVSVLQPIEKDAPELLLPYYHQAVNHYVSLKNRHDYKQAVKLLKRLEKVYKKMKLPERWERFFAGFTEKHSRLRALNEELKKGKLLG